MRFEQDVFFLIMHFFRPTELGALRLVDARCARWCFENRQYWLRQRAETLPRFLVDNIREQGLFWNACDALQRAMPNSIWGIINAHMRRAEVRLGPEIRLSVASERYLLPQLAEREAPPTLLSLNLHFYDALADDERARIPAARYMQCDFVPPVELMRKVAESFLFIGELNEASARGVLEACEGRRVFGGVRGPLFFAGALPMLRPVMHPVFFLLCNYVTAEALERMQPLPVELITLPPLQDVEGVLHMLQHWPTLLSVAIGREQYYRNGPGVRFV